MLGLAWRELRHEVPRGRPFLTSGSFSARGCEPQQQCTPPGRPFCTPSCKSATAASAAQPEGCRRRQMGAESSPQWAQALPGALGGQSLRLASWVAPPASGSPWPEDPGSSLFSFGSGPQSCPGLCPGLTDPPPLREAMPAPTLGSGGSLLPHTDPLWSASFCPSPRQKEEARGLGGLQATGDLGSPPRPPHCPPRCHTHGTPHPLRIGCPQLSDLYL